MGLGPCPGPVPGPGLGPCPGPGPVPGAGLGPCPDPALGPVPDPVWFLVLVLILVWFSVVTDLNQTHFL